MTSRLVNKLRNFAPLRSDDLDRLNALGTREKRYAGREDVILEGERPEHMFVLKEGMMMRYRVLPDGRRQILTFLIPGDICDLAAILIREMDHSICAVGPSSIRCFPREDLIRLNFLHPRISAAFWWSSLQEESIMRERIVALGRRPAIARLAYLFCEFYWRYEAIGLLTESVIRLPLTQAELGDTLGLTAIHVNRVLRDMRQAGLVERSRSEIHLLDFPGLKTLAQIDRDYLHFDDPPVDIGKLFDQLEREQDASREYVSA